MPKKLTQEEMPYLTQDGLGGKLREIFPGEEMITNRKIAGTGYRGRPDFYLPRRSLIVEFDGFQHYSQSKSVIADQEKDSEMIRLGIRVVRVPYFIQWCHELANSILLSTASHAQQTYPHGFIEEKAMLPADFCELGVKRFVNDIEVNFSWAKTSILRSLLRKSEKIGTLRTLPPSLQYLIAE
jgi:hypothetical protein